MSSNQHVRHRYRFGEFVLDPATRELRHVEQVLILAPKVFDCIVYLVENRDRAIGHDEITAAVWGRADVSDVQLRQLLRKVRRTLGDDGERQRVIRTVPHFGFHWITAVEVEAQPDTHSAPTASSASSLPAQPHVFTASRWMRIAAVTALVVLIASAAVTYLWLHRAAAPGPATTTGIAASVPRSHSDIAVLPLTIDAADDADLTWMRLGIMDLVASHLRKATLTAVSSSDIVALASIQTANASLPVRVREATGARDLVLPSASRIGGDWRVRLDLRREDGSQQRVEAQAPDAVTAARDASDRLLALLGKAPPVDLATKVPKSLTGILAAVEAAKLVSDYAAAERVLAASPAELRDSPDWQLERAQLDIETYRPEAARERLTKLLTSISAEADPVLRARVLTSLGRIDLNRPDQAVPRYTEAIALLVNADEPGLLGTAYNGRGVAHDRARQYNEARRDYARARVAYTVAGNSLGLARVDNNEALLEGYRGKPGDALPGLERAAVTFERFGKLDRLAGVLINQVSAYLALLQPGTALAVWERAKSKLVHFDDPPALRILDLGGAQSLAATGRLREARDLLDDVLRTLSPEREPLAAAIASKLLAELDLAAGNFDRSIAAAKRAVDLLADVNPGSDARAAVWLVLVRALHGEQRDAEAKSEIDRLYAWARAAGHPTLLWRARLAQAELAWVEGRRSAALQDFEAVLELVAEDGTPDELAEVVRLYGAALIGSGEVEQAAAVIGRMSRYAEHDYSLALLQVRLYHALGRREAWQAALNQARQLAGERPIPAELALAPPEIVQRE